MSLRNALQVSLMKLPKAIRKMSIGEFGDKFGGDVAGVLRKGVEEDVKKQLAEVEVIPISRKRIAKDMSSSISSSTPSTPSRASNPSVGRVTRSTRKQQHPKNEVCVIETPNKGGFQGSVAATPATVRAPRRGEVLLSANGSPLAGGDQLVATVKKRKSSNESESGSRRVAKNERNATNGANNSSNAATTIALELDAGDGTFVNLAEEGAVMKMDEDMKKTAVNKLKSLQDEVAALMAQLGSC